MIILLTNLAGLKHFDRLPIVTDTTFSAQLGRIKHYRNYIVNITDGKIHNTLFNKAWEDITLVCIVVAYYFLKKRASTKN